MTQAKLKLVAKRRRDAQKRHDRFAGSRTRCALMLESAGHYSIRILKVRATIGEPFNMARMPECLLSYKYGRPYIVLVEELERWLHERKSSLKSVQSGDLFATIYKTMGRSWARKRAKVRHRVWKEKE